MLAGVAAIAANDFVDVENIPRKKSLEESERLSLRAVLIRVLNVVKSLRLSFSVSSREFFAQVENSLISLAPRVQHSRLSGV